MKTTNRQLFILRYLFDQTDSEHYVTIADINSYLNQYDLDADRKTINECIDDLKEAGFDIRCKRSTQNRFFMSKHPFSLAEVKLLVDAVQSSRFIPQTNSKQIVDKLASLVGEHRGEILKRQLYMENRTKADNSFVPEFVELLYQAIHDNCQVTFQYLDYTSRKEKVLRHNGEVYTLSPYVLLWNNDQYYVVGFSEKHQTVSKFRVDRMSSLAVSTVKRVPQPENFCVSDYFEKEFSMLHGSEQNVELLCENQLMGSIIDKFGTDVLSEVVDEKHFKVMTQVALSSNFYGWVFASQGAMRILSPAEAVDGFRNCLKTYLNEP